jgi:hypothetical protein
MNMSLPLYLQPYSVFDKILRTNQGKIMRIARDFLKDENLAERATMHAFREVFLYKGTFESEEAMHDYIARRFIECVIRFMKDYPDTIKAAYHEQRKIEH